MGESRKAPLIVAKMHAGRYHSPFQPSSLAQTLREAYAQGAFERATLHDAVRAARVATRLHEGCPLASAAAIDPFEVFRLGKDVGRMELAAAHEGGTPNHH